MASYPYLQYVELRLTGVAIHRRRIAIPRNIQNVGSDEGIQSRLNTTFELIERESIGLGAGRRNHGKRHRHMPCGVTVMGRVRV
jgi:hypothetical protein